jgi:integral membrane sensor domain MASE1
MFRRKSIARHAIVALGFALAYVLLNRPEVIVLSRLGLTTWYPAIGLVLAVLLAVSPWYAVAVCVADVLSSVLIYHQPLLCFTTTAGTLGMAGSYTVAAHLLRTSLKIDPKLRKRQDIVRYLSVTSCAAIASGIIGVACLAAAHAIGWDPYWS